MILQIQKDYESGKIQGWQPDYDFLERENPNHLSIVGRTLFREEKKDTFLYRALFTSAKKLNPNYTWVSQYQKRGTCVGQGHKLGVDALMGVQHITNKTKFVGRAAVGPIYAGSRVDIAGQPGNWDGSNGIWAVKWLKNFGVVLLSHLKLPEDSLDPDERFATDWTKSRQGVPTEYENVAKQFPVQEYALVTDPEECGFAIQSGYPVTICSNVGFSNKRDALGFSRRKGNWNHCMLIWAVRWEKAGLLVQNSWSNAWNSGPKWPEDMPDGSFWITFEDARIILKQNDSFAISQYKGFPVQKLNYNFLRKAA